MRSYGLGWKAQGRMQETAASCRGGMGKLASARYRSQPPGGCYGVAEGEAGSITNSGTPGFAQGAPSDGKEAKMRHAKLILLVP